MVSKIKVKLYEYKSRHSINLPSEFVRDSSFPFQPNEELTAKIEGNKIILEKISKVKIERPNTSNEFEK